MHHSLIVLPDDTAKPILDAVVSAKRRGVHVRVMLNPARRSGESENEQSRKTLEAAGIEVRDSSPAFALTHQKSIVIDNTTGFVESLNWETRDLTETRDYAVVTTHRSGFACTSWRGLHTR